MSNRTPSSEASRGFHDPFHRRSNCRSLYLHPNGRWRVERLPVRLRDQFLDTVAPLGRFELAIADRRDDRGPRRRERLLFEFHLDIDEFRRIYFESIARLANAGQVGFERRDSALAGLEVLSGHSDEKRSDESTDGDNGQPQRVEKYDGLLPV